jgi:nicotinate phosphoribosyltransferase
MNFFKDHIAFYTDFYQLTMAQGYVLTGKGETRACFDYFFRENPFGGGYVIFAGLSDLLEVLEDFRFGNDEIQHLRGLGFREEFLSYLKEFRFRGTIHAVREGEVVFPLEPIVRVEGNIVESQVVETILLNILNFQSLIATKASRLKTAAGNLRVVDFGLRRAQALGGIHATKAAVIGGVETTSNVFSAYLWGLNVTGTQGHSWIQSFDDELTAFRRFADIYPDRCVLLVDTYSSLRSGIPNAITVGKELEQKGHRMIAIRLDSGDLAYLSKRARAMLDAAGLPYVKIVVSNQLDEYVIRSLLDQGAPIDEFGVGTHLVTGKQTPALDGVYKLAAVDGRPCLKFSENFVKTTLPGVKKVIRYANGNGGYYADAIALEEESSVAIIHHPFFPEQHSSLERRRAEPLLHKVVEDGNTLPHEQSVAKIAAFAAERMTHLSVEHKRFEFPHVYKVGISPQLLSLRSALYETMQQKIAVGGMK